MLEFQQFNMIWDKKMAEYETHAEDLVVAMKDRHASEAERANHNVYRGVFLNGGYVDH